MALGTGSGTDGNRFEDRRERGGTTETETCNRSPPLTTSLTFPGLGKIITSLKDELIAEGKLFLKHSESSERSKQEANMSGYRLIHF